MKKRSLLFATITVLLLTTVLLCSCQTGAFSGTNQQKGIWVTGKGEVTVAPNIVEVQLGIQVQAKTITEAQSQATTAMNDIMSVLTANGVASKDIQTQSYNIQQLTKWDYDKQELVITGYQIINMVSVKIRDITKAGAIIDAVAQAGGDLTRVNSIQFSIDDTTVYLDQARAKAMADAKDTATQLATLSNVKLGNPIYISETNVSIPRTVSVYTKDALDNASTPISTGELVISLTVQINYAIK